MKITEDKLSYQIIGKAMQVHRELGPGLDEIFYHELLSTQLKGDGIEHLFKPRQALIHRGMTADMFEPDLVVPTRFVVEAKALWGDFAPDHFVQVTSYLKFWKIEHALLLDFGKESLIQRRFIFSDGPGTPTDPAQLAAKAPPFVSNRAVVRQICECLSRLATTYGFGYRDTTYCGLIVADLLADGLPCVAEPAVTICARGVRLGESKLLGLVVEGQCVILPLSLRDQIRAADRAIVQTALRHLELPWGLVVNFAKHELQTLWVSAPRINQAAHE